MGLNEYSDYTKPVNVDNLGPVFLYFGFISASRAQNHNEQGLQVCTLIYWSTLLGCVGTKTRVNKLKLELQDVGWVL